MSTENPVPQRRPGPHAPLPTPPAADEKIASPSKEEVASATGAPAVTREEDPRARAARRMLEAREHGSPEDGTDKFYIDPRIIPDGWSYEWRTHTVFGKEDPSYAVNLARKYWEAVPRTRHPELMPANYAGETILREGMMLMERPKEMTDEAKAKDYRNAREQVRAKETQLSGAPPGQFERDNKGAPMAIVKKSYETIKIPD
jgi:hypothetical protein